jgi:hypothetical protein
MASAFQAFGQKIANITDLHPTSAQGHANSGDQFNNAKTIAESLNAKPSIDLFEHIDPENKEKEQLKQAYVKETVMNLKQFGAKLAASSCSPCDMPHGPTNKKHMTGASPAVLEADEASEEIGQPETTETEHDKSVVSGKIAARKEKRAVMGAGTVIGALGGLATGRSGQRARAAGRGAAKGLGWDIGATVGAAPGMALGGLGGLMIGGPGGAALGVPLGGVAGGLTGGLLGHSVASSAIGPDETDEEKLERLLALREKMQRNNGKSAAHVFGSKVAEIAFNAPAGDYASAPRPAWHAAVDREARERANSGLAANLPPPHLQGGPAPKPKTTPWYRPDQYGGQRNWFDSAIEGVMAAPGVALKGLKQAPQSLKEMAGLASELPGALPTPSSSYAYGSGPASASAQGKLQSVGKPGPIAMPSPETPAPAGGSAPGGMDLQTALMYGIPVGLGGAGLYALYNYLNSQPRKKKEEEAPQG